MLPQKRRSTLKWVLSIAIVIGIAAMGFFLGRIDGQKQEASMGSPEPHANAISNPNASTATNRTQPPGPSTSSEPGRVDSNLSQSIHEVEKVSESSELRYEYTYSLCNHIYEESLVPSLDQLGKTQAQLSQLLPGCTIESFSPEKVRIKKQIDQFCPQHLMLRLDGETCAIYRSTMGSDELQKTMDFHVSVDKWEAELLQSLREGIVFDNYEDLEAFVEDVES